MSEERLVPKLRFVDENDEWNLLKLSDVLNEKGYIRGPFGSALKRGEMKNEGIPVYEQQHAIYDNRIFRYYIDENKFQELKRFQVLPNDLIVSCSGTIGKTSLIRKNDESGIISQALLILRSNPNIIHPKFLKYFLETDKGYNSLISSAGGSSQVNIAKKQIILDIPLVVPNLQLQCKIIYFLDKITNKIQLLERKYEKYQDFKKYLMQQIFAQKLRFNFDDNWNKFNLGDISTIGKGFTPSTSNSNYWDGDIDWLSIADMNQGKYITETSKKITEEGCKNKKIVEKDTLIMSFKLTIGRLGILKKDMFTNEAICNFKWKNNDILTEYMYYYLSSINILKYGSQAAKGITLNNDTLSTIPVLLPSIEEQEKIVDILSNMDTKIQFIENNIEDVKKFKKGLLQQMFV